MILNLTNLSIYKIVFTIEMLIAMFLFSSKLEKRKMSWLRYIGSSVVCVTISIFFPIIDDISYSWWYSSLMFLTLFLLCVASLFFILKTSWQNIFLIAITAYTAQHLSYQIFTIICYALKFNTSLQDFYSNDKYDFTLNLINSLRWLVTIVVYSLVYVSVFNLFVPRIKIEGKINNFFVVPISGLILIVDILANSIIVYNSDNGNITVAFIICFYNILSCLLIFFILFFILHNMSLKEELLIKSVFLEQAEDKYEQSKANVEMINLKVHDFKHQLRTLVDKTSLNEKDIKQMEDMIQIYDSNMTTGNKAVDIILMEKKLLCQKKNIDLKCFADCSSLSYMDDADLYSLFGNAIDNAIEAVEKLNDSSRKTINVLVKTINNFMSIRFENYYEGKIQFEKNGLPSTTKENKQNHGIGLKSMQSLVEKYGGNMIISTKENVFSISILFPKKK